MADARARWDAAHLRHLSRSRERATAARSRSGVATPSSTTRRRSTSSRRRWWRARRCAPPRRRATAARRRGAPRPPRRRRRRADARRCDPRAWAAAPRLQAADLLRTPANFDGEKNYKVTVDASTGLLEIDGDVLPPGAVTYGAAYLINLIVVPDGEDGAALRRALWGAVGRAVVVDGDGDRMREYADAHPHLRDVIALNIDGALFDALPKPIAKAPGVMLGPPGDATTAAGAVRHRRRRRGVRVDRGGDGRRGGDRREEAGGRCRSRRSTTRRHAEAQRRRGVQDGAAEPSEEGAQGTGGRQRRGRPGSTRRRSTWRAAATRGTARASRPRRPRPRRREATGATR